MSLLVVIVIVLVIAAVGPGLNSPSYECTQQPQVVWSSKQHKPTQHTLAIKQPSDDCINAIFTTQRQKVQVVDMRDDERSTDEQ